MRKFLLSTLTFLLLGGPAFNQSFETLEERKGEKTLKGIISRSNIESDSSFPWYASNLKGYTPNSLALDALQLYKDSIQIIAFMGTWCEDSHTIIPKFFSLTDRVGFAANRVTLIGVDRNKKTLSNLADALDIKNVPTLMVMKNGKEVGRVVEYGKYGMWDKELGEIIMSAFKK